MSALETAPGVVGVVVRAYVVVDDVMQLLGCKKSLAYKTIKKINAQEEKAGRYAFPGAKANKYSFADSFGIPVEFVDAVIRKRDGEDGRGAKDCGTEDHEEKGLTSDRRG